MAFGITNSKSTGSLLEFRIWKPNDHGAAWNESTTITEHGAEVCGSEGADSSVRIAVPHDEASTYVVRFHPEDAENYHLNEVVEVEPNPAGRGSMAVIERLEPGPSSACLKNDVLVQNIVENLQTVLFPSGDCVSLGGAWTPRDDTVWTPY